jgi:transcriptional regulator with XRE-family HTH domain
MEQKTPLPQLREQAVALRRAGKSRREIAEILHITNHDTLNEALRGEPPQPWTWRPNAKDDLRAKARELREQGLDYEEIVAELGVSKSSVSLWVRDMPRPERLTEQACRERSLELFRRYWAAQRPIREAARQADVRAAFAEIGQLNDREVLIAGAIAYWCEGTKNKPHNRRIDRVAFINSDPALICFFMRFLAVAGITRDRLICRLHIHESADVEAAQRFWLDVTGLEPEQFARPTLKRHNPTTVRKNTGDNYHGCLRIDVRRGAGLYRKIEGWAVAAMSDSKSTEDPGQEALR